MMVEGGTDSPNRHQDVIGRTRDALVFRNTNRSHPCQKLIHDEITFANDPVVICCRSLVALLFQISARPYTDVCIYRQKFHSVGAPRFLRTKTEKRLRPLKLPMRRYMPQPFDAGGLEAHVGIDTARDGVVNDPLLLLLQQLDQLLLGTAVAPDSR